MSILLTRDDFRNSVFERDHHRCVICKEPAVDAHHIIDRRLFTDGGYYINNGASVCERHHLEAESTLLSCSDIRKAAGITEIVLPEHLYQDAEYDKWGNEILSNGQRLRGELFNDESVQKIMAPVLDLFTDKIKYSRTYHLWCSPGVNRDDRVLKDLSGLEGEEVVITEKCDGENTTMYPYYLHARSLDSDSHPSRNWVKNEHAKKGYNIPEGWRVCGENLYAKHAIHYTKEKGNALKSYFYMFSIWDDKNICLSWDQTIEWAFLLDFTLVPVLYRGPWDLGEIERLNKKMEASPDTMEGYVVRVVREFHYSEFKNVVAKYVRANHVQNNHGHWSQAKIIPNELI